jgi:hypothetical protein
MSKFRSSLSSIGNGLLTATSVAVDLPTLTRMTELERQMDELQKEYAELNEKLVNDDRRRPTPYIQK